MILQADGDDGVVVAALPTLATGAATAASATIAAIAAALLGESDTRKGQGREEKADDLKPAGHDVTPNGFRRMLPMLIRRGTSSPGSLLHEKCARLPGRMSFSSAVMLGLAPSIS